MGSLLYCAFASSGECVLARDTIMKDSNPWSPTGTAQVDRDICVMFERFV
jgi:hypothetical protein